MNVVRYFLLLVFFNTSFSNEIAVEKKTFEEEITQFNENLALLKKDLSEKYAQVSLFHKEKVAVEKYSKLLKDNEDCNSVSIWSESKLPDTFNISTGCFVEDSITTDGHAGTLNRVIKRFDSSSLRLLI